MGSEGLGQSAGRIFQEFLFGNSVGLLYVLKFTGRSLSGIPSGGNSGGGSLVLEEGGGSLVPEEGGGSLVLGERGGLGGGGYLGGPAQHLLSFAENCFCSQRQWIRGRSP